jgi:hypothetical protein
MINELEMDLIKRMNIAVLGGNAKPNVRKIEIVNHVDSAQNSITQKDVDRINKLNEDETIKSLFENGNEYEIELEENTETTNTNDFNVNGSTFSDANTVYRYLNTILTKYKSISDDIIKGYMGDIPKHHLENLVNNMVEETNNAFEHIGYKIKIEKIEE